MVKTRGELGVRVCECGGEGGVKQVGDEAVCHDTNLFKKGEFPKPLSINM